MSDSVKEKVKEFYGGIAKKVSDSPKSSCCCGSSCCGDVSVSSGIYDMELLKGLPIEAVNASLGCANPIAFAMLKEGEIALDLGSGGGIDVFIASKFVGKSGKVYGLDMTEDMLALASKNKEKMGIQNVEFLKGYIEDIPMPDEAVDVILSNCVINLCENKEKALSEAYRVLKTGGRLAIADIVILKDIPDEIRKSAELWAGCIAGALPVREYIRILQNIGFKDVEVEPVNVYTRDIIDSIMGNENMQGLCSNVDRSILDGAFAGAYVKAVK